MTTKQGTSRQLHAKEVGSGITRYRVAVEKFDPKDSDDFRSALSQSAEFGRDPFRNRFGGMVEAAQERLRELIAQAGDEPTFNEHDDEGWYCQRIDVEYRRALKAVEVGAIQRALDHAAKVGWYVSEWTIKFEREPLWQRGLDNERATTDGGGANRKGHIETRLARFEALQLAGVRRMEAYNRIAEEEGSSPATVGDAIRRAKKI